MGSTSQSIEAAGEDSLLRLCLKLDDTPGAFAPTLVCLLLCHALAHFSTLVDTGARCTNIFYSAVMSSCHNSHKCRGIKDVGA